MDANDPLSLESLALVDQADRFAAAGQETFVALALYEAELRGTELPDRAVQLLDVMTALNRTAESGFMPRRS